MRFIFGLMSGLIGMLAGWFGLAFLVVTLAGPDRAILQSPGKFGLHSDHDAQCAVNNGRRADPAFSRAPNRDTIDPIHNGAGSNKS
jgi:hypothetical protein